VISQSLILLSKFSVNNQTKSFNSAYNIANGLDYINSHPPPVRVFNGVINSEDQLNAISTATLNTVYRKMKLPLST
jgi:hypothetical protein